MELLEMNPFVRYASYGQVNPRYKTVRAYDSRLYYDCSGIVNIDVAEQELQLLPGSVLIIPQGIPYRFNIYEDTRLATLNFDFICVDIKKTTFYPLVPEGQSYEPKPFRELVPFSDCEALNHPLLLKNMNALEEPLLRICAEFRALSAYSHAFNSAVLKSVLIRCALAAEKNTEQKNDISLRLPSYIREHCCEELTGETLADYFGYHKVHLNRIMNHCVGMTMHQYMIQCRIEKAKLLLVETEDSIEHIAEQTGFHYAGYFSDLFHRTVGISAKEYRLQHKQYI